MPEAKRKVRDVDLAFPADVSEWLPAWDTIPPEFKEWNNPYASFVRTVFFDGLKLDDWNLAFKPGITLEDAQERWRQVQACLRSFQPKHEHKEAGCAYLCSQFMEPPTKKTP